MKLIDVEKRGFVIDNKYRKGWATSKKILLRSSVVKALEKARDLLPEGFNFKVRDGWRSVADQKKIIQICEDDFKKKFPKNWNNMLTRYTGGYKALKERPFYPASHLGGGAVDITIIRGKREIPLGGVTFSETDNINYYEKKKRLTKMEKEIRNNRKLLKKVMRKAGFKVYNPEWWHWGYIK